MQHIIKDREDLHVARSGGPKSVITKQAKTDKGIAEILREVEFLQALADTPYVPKLFDHTEGRLPRLNTVTMQDVGDSHEITDEYKFRTHLIRMLHSFRSHGVVHGDLTSPNIRIVDNVPKIIDWAESRKSGEDRPDKRTGGDTWWAWHFASQWADGSRVARRWFAIYNAVIAQFGPHARIELLDIGCFHGDIAAAACAAGWAVQAVDINEQAIRVCEARWSGLPMDFFYQLDSVIRQPEEHWYIDVLTVLSVYPYIVEQYGNELATTWIANIIESVGLLFFECQLAGDGPGPSWAVNNDAVQSFLEDCGGREVEAVVEIELPDRHTSRTVFKVKGKGAS